MRRFKEQKKTKKNNGEVGRRVEKNATQWSKDKLSELLVGLTIENDQLRCDIKELKKCDGEASANNRKAKLVYLYEWHIEAKYEGYIKDSDNDNKTKYQGELEIPNLSDENSIDEVDISYSIEKETKGQKFKELMITHGTPIIRHRLSEYVRLLKEQFSQGLILPTKDKIISSSIEKKPPPPSTQRVVSKSNSSTSSTTSSSSSKILETKDLVIEDYFKCSRNELFQTFTDINRVKAFTQNSVQHYDCKQGGWFSLFGGNITGNFIDIIPYDTIEMLWRFKQWPEEHFSHVRLEFIDEKDQTKLVVRQNGVPAHFYDNTMEGWKRFYIDSIKQTFGYGSRLI
ncbi:unnamed protein product [Didymodactylos carnosus]|uniref:Activator of Hsp90 ATPase AHSA1-like N-terminal domain-containing protein n=1 Tax=Didymodactylos carnosus TaxID=1234261 RepID=A0A814MTJ3_9BILA|nr:unnamed protein product [Didymodactylos carnosus]CAF1082351.1 unnamed protein product [Didymodactylos carnosus]CAF3620568.1 unnamed protein product [Didymodactylos carnosus]CAF3848156.1 unnamed protein product [Didymodactylos carnosus]